MTNVEIATASKIMLGTSEAVAMYIGSTLIWSQGGGQQEHDYSQDYFTIESLEDNNAISTKNLSCNQLPTFQYSADNGESWSTITTAKNTTQNITTLNTGQKIIVKGTNTSLATAYNCYNKFIGKKNFKVYGNVMSLLYGNQFLNQLEFEQNSICNLCGLFYGATTLTDASDLVLPALTLKESCYNGMFRGCSNLVNGPKLLPALDVPKDGYSSMFEGCVSLVGGPEIRATTVSGTTALNRMFCMSRSSKVTAAMTKSPILRITNPASYANTYQQLFCGNGNITEVTILAPNGTDLSFNNWLNYNSGSGVIKKLASTTLSSGNSGLPNGWTTENYVEPSS